MLCISDERAVIFGKLEFHKQKVMDFLSTIDGLKSLDKLDDALARFVNSSRYARAIQYLYLNVIISFCGTISRQ